MVVVALAAVGCSSEPRPSPNSPLIDEGPITTVPALDDEDRCGPFNGTTLMHCVQQTNLKRSVEMLAQPRPPGSAHHRAVANHCASQLDNHGYQIERHRYEGGLNIVGIKPGFSRPSQRLLVAAHYDHLPKCRGADDNASGVAATLEIARVLSTARFDRTLVVACWDGGEQGQAGSKAYAHRARQRREDIRLAVSLEAIGFVNNEPQSQKVLERFDEVFPDATLALEENSFRADFITLVTESPSLNAAAAFIDRASEVSLTAHALRLTRRMKAKHRDFHPSDHVSFWDYGFPALLVTDSGAFRNPNFHCAAGSDSPDTLDYTFITRVSQAVVGTMAAHLEVR